MELKPNQLRWIAFFVLAYSVYLVYGIHQDTDKIMKREIPEAIGLGQELKAVVDSLEQDIASRLTYELDIERDPMDVSRVAPSRYAKGSNEFSESSGMRLSCTIITDNNQQAVIKFRSKSYVVGKGEKLFGRKIKDISTEEVVMEWNGRQIKLKNKPAPPGEFAADKRSKLKDIQL